jgi:hypothetical protein
MNPSAPAHMSNEPARKQDELSARFYVEQGVSADAVRASALTSSGSERNSAVEPAIAVLRASVTHPVVFSDQATGALFLTLVRANGFAARFHSIFPRDDRQIAILTIRRGNLVAVLLNLEIAVAFDRIGRLGRSGETKKTGDCHNRVTRHFFISSAMFLTSAVLEIAGFTDDS